ncbi:hypothetical protein GACE_1834 [Geoglobus acetivorans]|uniref:Heat-shock protein n=2 Tax=Geoglobus acetivorans TaxID=565033 RepID=A0A0A7GFM4_GEOAI|nr:hypothetical protein GACE_1834 [Geoglobus acetivorans]
MNLAASFIVGLVLYFMLFGLYKIVAGMNIILNTSLIFAVFAVSFIISGVILEHRSQNPERPYYLIGALIIALVITFVFLCTVNGLLVTAKEGLPDTEIFVTYVSALTAMAFAIIKILSRGIPETRY